MEFSHRKASESKVQSSEILEMSFVHPPNSMGFEGGLWGVRVQREMWKNKWARYGNTEKRRKGVDRGEAVMEELVGKGLAELSQHNALKLATTIWTSQYRINYLCMSYLIIFIPLKTMESSTCQWNLCLQTRFISCLIGWVVVPGLISIVCEEADGNVPYIRANHP